MRSLERMMSVRPSVYLQRACIVIIHFDHFSADLNLWLGYMDVQTRRDISRTVEDRGYLSYY